MSGRLLGIATRTATKLPMTSVAHSRVTTAAGVDGEFRGTPGDRQVVVVGREGWEAACRELGARLDWKLRRGNLYVEGVACRVLQDGAIAVGDAVSIERA
jgi:MOSC domain-containing protein YiiM